MDAPAIELGALVMVVGLVLLILSSVWSEPARRERRRARNLELRARETGLRGHWALNVDRTGSGRASEYGTYQPASDEDRALYEAVGSRIQGEAKFFASEMLWTDARLAWAGIVMLLIGIAMTVGSILN